MIDRVRTFLGGMLILAGVVASTGPSAGNHIGDLPSTLLIVGFVLTTWNVWARVGADA